MNRRNWIKRLVELGALGFLAPTLTIPNVDCKHIISSIQTANKIKLKCKFSNALAEEVWMCCGALPDELEHMKGVSTQAEIRTAIYAMDESKY